MNGYTKAIDVIKQAKKYIGAPYKFGAERKPTDNPQLSIDCSELVQNAFARAGLTICDGARYQYRECEAISVEAAVGIPGALVFWRESKSDSISHVGISTGQGNVIEATSPHVRVISISARKWTEAGLPKCLYGQA